MKKTIFIVSILLVLLIALNTSADPVTYGFYGLTNTSAVDTAIGKAQLFVAVSSAGEGQVTFHFYNTGSSASSICDIYFDDGTLLGISSIDNGSGVLFDKGATPAELPGGNNVSPAFDTTTIPGHYFSADSHQPVQPNGVNPEEYINIIFDLKSGKSLDDVIAALALAGADGGLRIGIHVQGFAGGGSESFINNPTPVPEPGILILLGIAMSAIGIAAPFVRKI